jgi:hypothetical protein
MDANGSLVRVTCDELARQVVQQQVQRGEVQVKHELTRKMKMFRKPWEIDGWKKVLVTCPQGCCREVRPLL